MPSDTEVSIKVFLNEPFTDILTHFSSALPHSQHWKQFSHQVMNCFQCWQWGKAPLRFSIGISKVYQSISKSTMEATTKYTTKANVKKDVQNPISLTKCIWCRRLEVYECHTFGLQAETIHGCHGQKTLHLVLTSQCLTTASMSKRQKLGGLFPMNAKGLTSPASHVAPSLRTQSVWTVFPWPSAVTTATNGKWVLSAVLSQDRG